MNKKNFILLLSIVMMFGCGGGDSITNNSLPKKNTLQDNNTSPENNIPQGNNTSHENNTSKKIIGYLIDSAVQGVKYTCGETIGLTDKEGKFICPTFPIKFYIGKLFLGEITKLPSDLKVFPQDIVGVNRDVFNDEVIKLATLLQSLDNDNNPSNDINITRQINNSFENDESNISLTDTNIDDLSSINSNVHQIPKDEVKEHLTQSITNVGLPIGYTFPVINNQGQSIETTLDEYTIKLYANYQESADAQKNHRGVVVDINNEHTPTMAIQSTYKGKFIVAGVYKDRKLVAVSKLFEITDASLLFIEVKI